LLKSPQVWLAVERTPIVLVAKSHIETAETTPPSDGDSITERIARIVVAGFLILFPVGLIIMQVRPWESQFNFIFGSALVLPLAEAMYSVRLYLFIPYTTTAYTHSLVVQCIHDLAGIRQTLHRNVDGGSSVY
jgi:hypothetical protein